MLLRTATKVKFCLIDIPNKSVANIWQKVTLLQRCVRGSTTLSNTQLEVIAPCVNYTDKHALERIQFLYRAIPVSLLPAALEVEPFLTLDMSLRADRFTRRVTFVQIFVKWEDRVKGDLSGRLKVQPDHAFAFVQYCLPRVLFSADNNASAFLKGIDLLRVAPIKAIGFKHLDPEEYAFQAFKYKQDKEYFNQLVTEISKLVQLAKTVGEGAFFFVFDPDIANCATIRLKHTTFPQLAAQLDSHPKVLLDNNHTLYLLLNLAYEKAIQKCVSS